MKVSANSATGVRFRENRHCARRGSGDPIFFGLDELNEAIAGMLAFERPAVSRTASSEARTPPS